MPSKNTTQVVCVAEFWAEQGKSDNLVAALHALMEPTHKEPGCIRYELSQRTDDERGVTFIEKWKDKAAFDEHCATPYITQFFNDGHPKFVERFEVKLYEEILP
jgi:quinol monooxygenase YgiN